MGCGSSTQNEPPPRANERGRKTVASTRASPQASRHASPQTQSLAPPMNRAKKYEKAEIEFELLQPPSGHAPSARKMHSGVAVQDHSLVVFGGVSRTEAYDATDSLEASLNLNKVSICQQTFRVSVQPPNVAKWHKVQVGGSDVPKARATHRAVNIQGSMYVFGSHNKSCSDVFVYNIVFGTWRRLKVSGKKPRPVSGCSLTKAPGVLVVFGGEGDHGVSNELYLFHLDSNHWTRVSPKGPLLDGARTQSEAMKKLLPRRDHSAFVTGDKLLVYGGFGLDSEALDFISFDAKAAEWSAVKETGAIPKKRGAHAACMYGHYMIVFGGQRHGRFLNDLHVFDVHQGLWTSVAILARSPSSFVPSPRAFAAASLIGRTMYVHGGGDDKSIFADFFRIDVHAVAASTDPMLPYDGDDEPPQRSPEWAKLAAPPDE